MPKMPKEPHHSGANTESKGTGNLKGRRVAGSKKTIAAKRSVSKGKISVKKA